MMPRQIGAPPDTPLHMVHNKPITSSQVTKALRAACQAIGQELNVRPSDISARALRAGGAMALLRAKIDPVEIKMVGRWRSWAMLRYLHQQGLDTLPFANQMLQMGHFQISSHSPLPSDVASIISKYPPNFVFPPE